MTGDIFVVTSSAVLVALVALFIYTVLDRPDEWRVIEVPVDSSWADALPPCVACGAEVPWDDALLMPCSHIEDGDVTAAGVVHRHGCPQP